MKIAVMGAGALGCYFGGRLASSGVDVSFIARGAHLEALQRDGLTVESPLGDLRLEKVQATSDPAEIGPVDIVLFLVKLPDTRKAAQQIAPLLHENTGVLSFQNGIDAWNWIGDEIGAQHVIGGTAVIPAMIKSPGVISHSAEIAKLVLGEFDGSQSPRCVELLSLLQDAGVDATLVSDIDVRIWEKFVMLSTFSAVTALCRLPIGPIRDDPEAAKLLKQLLSEVMSVGLELCSGLSRDHEQAVLQLIGKMPDGVRSSLLDDLTRGKPLEVAYLSGAVLRKAKKLGLEAPAHEIVFRALSPFVHGAPKAV